MQGAKFFAALAVAGVFGWSATAQAGIIGADVGKNLEYFQSGPSTVAPIGTDNAFFFARTFYANPGDFDGGDVLAPTSVDYAYNSTAFDCCGHVGGQYQTAYIDPATMDSLFPTGTYVLTATNSSIPSSQSVSIDVTGDLFGSMPLPQFDPSSYAALVNQAAGAGGVVSFNTFTPVGAAFGQTFLSVFDLTHAAFFGGFVGPSSTTSSFDLSGVTFKPGDTYEVQLIFDSGVGSTDPNGIPLTWRSDLRTDVFFTIAGVPEPQSWAVMLTGLLGLGVVLRRRRAIA